MMWCCLCGLSTSGLLLYDVVLFVWCEYIGSVAV